MALSLTDDTNLSWAAILVCYRLTRQHDIGLGTAVIEN